MSARSWRAFYRASAVATLVLLGMALAGALMALPRPSVERLVVVALAMLALAVLCAFLAGRAELRAEQPPRACAWRPAHLPTVVYTRRPRDLWRKRYVVRCWNCGLRRGPYKNRVEAEAVRRRLDALVVATNFPRILGSPREDRR